MDPGDTHRDDTEWAVQSVHNNSACLAARHPKRATRAAPLARAAAGAANAVSGTRRERKKSQLYLSRTTDPGDNPADDTLTVVMPARVAGIH